MNLFPSSMPRFLGKALVLSFAAVALFATGCSKSAESRQLKETQTRLATAEKELEAMKAHIGVLERNTIAERETLQAELRRARETVATEQQAAANAAAPAARGLAPASASYEVAGEVFIATAGGANIKLGLVQIGALDKAEAAAALQTSQKDIDAALAAAETRLRAAAEAAGAAEVDADKAAAALRDSFSKPPIPSERSRLEKAADDTRRIALAKRAEATAAADALPRLRSARTWFGRLPNAYVLATTDSEGRYHMSVPRGRELVLAARATRTLASGVEFYYWLVPVPTPTGDRVELTLSNANARTE